MSVEKVREYLKEKGLEDRLLEFPVSSATVELAAKAIGCEPDKIVKTMSFMTKDGPILICLSGDARISNPKFKERFGGKPTMISPEEVEGIIGHGVGGVCPFAVKEGVMMYPDVSMKRFRTVYPAGGDPKSVVRLDLNELLEIVPFEEWVDVSKDYDADAR